MEAEKKLTIREQIILNLEMQPMTARDLSKALHISEKEVYAHMPYIEKSIRQLKKKIKTIPCSCLKCGFEFRNRKTFKKPGKCPQCRESRIEPAVFEIAGV
jgi:predicted Zn-ribbon and HTH transcriptional regulator